MLKDTLSKFFKVDSLIENLTGFVEIRVELLKLEVKEDVAKGLAKGVAWFVIGFVLTLFLVFASIGLALLIGATLGLFAGFMIIASAYLIFGLILLLLREKIVSALEHRFSFMFRKKQ